MGDLNLLMLKRKFIRSQVNLHHENLSEYITKSELEKSVLCKKFNEYQDDLKIIDEQIITLLWESNPSEDEFNVEMNSCEDFYNKLNDLYAYCSSTEDWFDLFLEYTQSVSNFEDESQNQMVKEEYSDESEENIFESEDRSVLNDKFSENAEIVNEKEMNEANLQNEIEKNVKIDENLKVIKLQCEMEFENSFSAIDSQNLLKITENGKVSMSLVWKLLEKNFELTRSISQSTKLLDQVKLMIDIIKNLNKFGVAERIPKFDQFLTERNVCSFLPHVPFLKLDQRSEYRTVFMFSLYERSDNQFMVPQSNEIFSGPIFLLSDNLKILNSYVYTYIILSGSNLVFVSGRTFRQEFLKFVFGLIYKWKYKDLKEFDHLDYLSKDHNFFEKFRTSNFKLRYKLLV